MTPDLVLVKEFLNRSEADSLLDRIRTDADFKQN